MPCNAAPAPEFSRHDLDAVEIYYKAEVDRVTRVACEAIKALKRNGLYDALSDEAQAWSHEHDAWDAARTLIKESVRATVRRSTFDDKGNEIDYGDGRHALDSDDVDALERTASRDYGVVDQELARQVFEDMVGEELDARMDYQQEGDDAIEESFNDLEEPEA